MKLPDFISIWNSSEAKSIAWKNGGGQTKEVAIAPAGNDFSSADFLWRLSQAEISRDGEFSSFPGYERLLGIVDGVQLNLRHGKSQTQLQRGDVIRFSGDDSTYASVPEGAVQDLGLIFRRERVRAEMHEIAFLGKPRSFSLKAKTNFFFSASGRFQLSIYPQEWNLLLEEFDAARVDRDESSFGEERLILIEPKDKLSRIIAVEIDW